MTTPPRTPDPNVPRRRGTDGRFAPRITGPEAPAEEATPMTDAALDDSPADEDVLPDDRFLNRELSWLDFNARVLALAEDPETPLLERAKFLAIFASNLD